MRRHTKQTMDTGGYDSLDRLRQYQRGILAEGGGSVDTPISLPNTDVSRQYVLDGVGNWRRNIAEPVGGALAIEVRQHNSLNQITQYGATPCTYDKNGNLLDDGIRLYEWDALNRLAIVKKKAGNVTIGTYTYDALNRRIRRVVANGGLSGTISNGTTDCLYLGWRVMEERDGSNNPTKQFVWGEYLDELIQQKHLVTIDGLVAGNYYPLTDLLYRTVALTDSTGDIVEAYDTDAYGNTLIFNAAGTGGDWWADDATQTAVATCEFIFTGQRSDPESMLQFFKRRYYLANLGRFLSRDPADACNGHEQAIVTSIGIWIEEFEWCNYLLLSTSRNLYLFVDASPEKNTDPYGLDVCQGTGVVLTKATCQALCQAALEKKGKTGASAAAQCTLMCGSVPFGLTCTALGNLCYTLKNQNVIKTCKLTCFSLCDQTLC